MESRGVRAYWTLVQRATLGTKGAGHSHGHTPALVNCGAGSWVRESLRVEARATIVPPTTPARSDAMRIPTFVAPRRSGWLGKARFATNSDMVNPMPQSTDKPPTCRHVVPV